MLHELDKELQKRKHWFVRWVNYYKLANMGNALKAIDKWMRRRIRMNIWKEWKRVRTRCHNLKKLGLSHDEAMKLAGSRKGYWRLSQSPNLSIAITNKRLEQAGYLFFSSYYKTVKV